MSRLANIFLSLCVLLVLGSCGSAKKGIRKRSESKPPEINALGANNASSPTFKKYISSLSNEGKSLNKSTLSYIDQFAYAAMGQMKSHKIPASITMAQGILESGNGNSELARKSKNHFGIKCHKGWTGPSVRYDDDKKNECFRKYSDVMYSYNDHSEFLKGRSRYAFLFDYKIDDYKKWAKGLKKAGYATDKKYPTKLIKIIEDYKLYKLDHMVLRGKITSFEKPTQQKPVQKTIPENPIRLPNQHVVKPGETLYAVSKLYGIEIAHIKWLNRLSTNDLSVGQVLSLKDKVAKQKTPEQRTIKKAKSHVVQKGETLYAISRLYGLKAEDIIALNNLESSTIEIGQVLSVKMSQEIIPVKQQQDEKVKEPIANNEFFIYEVGRGDNLYNISKRYETSVELLMSWNGLDNSDISLGQKIKIKRTMDNNPADKNVHKVSKGDTLFKIARLYDISVDKIMSINSLDSANLSIGQVLRLK